MNQLSEYKYVEVASIRRQYNVHGLEVFGSVIWGMDFNPVDSDIDLQLALGKPINIPRKGCDSCIAVHFQSSCLLFSFQ